mgnify:CR=1 FL=1
MRFRIEKLACANAHPQRKTGSGQTLETGAFVRSFLAKVNITSRISHERSEIAHPLATNSNFITNKCEMPPLQYP